MASTRWAAAWTALADDLEARAEGTGGRRDRIEHFPDACGMCLLMSLAHKERAKYARSRALAPSTPPTPETSPTKET